MGLLYHHFLPAPLNMRNGKTESGNHKCINQFLDHIKSLMTENTKNTYTNFKTILDPTKFRLASM